jgi:hypothetical protein
MLGTDTCGLRRVVMRVTVVVAALFGIATSLGCAQSADLKPPAEWGEPVDGLRCALTCEETTVPMGARLRFVLHLGFDPEGVDPNVGLLNRGPNAWRPTFSFTDVKTGKVFVRSPHDGGLPRGVDPEDIVRLRNGRLSPESIFIRLLSTEGKQVPAGIYRVAVGYENSARPEVEVYVELDGLVGTRPHKGPLKFWKGKLTSAPIIFEVTEAEAEELELKVNSSLVVKAEGNRLGWTWGTENPTKIKVKRRPGYVVGTRYSRHIFLDGVEIEKGGGGLGSGSLRNASGMSYLPLRISERLKAGQKLTLRVDLEVLETSVPVGHMWRPEAGDCKVLWKGSIEGTYVKPAEWGKAVDGLRTRVVVEQNEPWTIPDIERMPEGGHGMPPRVLLRLQLRNDTDEVVIYMPPLLWEPNALLVTHADGKPIACENLGGLSALVQPVRIGPGKTQTVAETSLAGRYDVSRPGRYKVQFPETKSDAPKTAVTRDILPASNVFEFEIRPEPVGDKPAQPRRR